MRIAHRRQHHRGRALFVATLFASGCTREPRVPPTPPPHEVSAAPLAGEPRSLFAEAVAHAARGEDDAAHRLFLALLDRYPELEDYHLAHLAAIEERAGHLADAVRFDDRLIANHPDSVWFAQALARRARVAAALGDPAAAAEFAARARGAPDADAPTRAAALLVEADLRAAGDPRGAYLLYQEVRRLGGDAAIGARTGITVIESAHPELRDDSQLQLDEGTLLLAEGRLDAAAERLERAGVAGDPAIRSAALRGLAKVRQRQGRIDDAILCYRNAAALEPAPGGTAWFELATLFWNRDDDAEAGALFARLLREAPRHPKRDTARYALGRIAELGGKRTQAEAHYRRLIATSTDTELVREARWRLAWGSYSAGRLAVAIDAFRVLARTNALDAPAALYWEGRVRERRDGAAAAAPLYADVLTRAPDSYYAELSEQRLGEHAPAPPTPEPLAGDPPAALVAHTYHWSRSQELHAMALDRAAAREINALARAFAGTPEPFLLEAYREVGAHTRALRLASELQGERSLPPQALAAYLYPRAYWQLVVDESTTARLDPYLVLALIRQESLFDPDARSPADAYGLMQLLVRTATRVAGAPVGAAELTDPATNVRLGTRYLRELLDRFAGNLRKALAAYNGGEEAVAKWEARAAGSDDDEFVESISFRETRKYVKAVLGNYRRYRRLYGAPAEQRAVATLSDS